MSATSASILDRLLAAHAKVAKLVAQDAAFLPIFESFETDIAIERQRLAAQARAKMIVLRQRDLAELV